MPDIRSAILALTPDVYWPLDEMSGTVANDISGNGRNGTYQGAVIFGVSGLPGDGGKTAVSFNFQPGAPPFKGMTRAGLSDHANLSIILHFWNGAQSVPVSEVPMSWSGTSTDGYYIQFNSASGLFNAQIGQAAGYGLLNDPENESQFANKWNQVVLTWQASTSTFSFYVNGALRSQLTSVALHGTPPSMSFALGFFNFGTGPQQAYTGNMAHVAIVPSVLGAVDINALYDASGIAPASVGNVAQVSLAAVSPTSYALGTASSGLTGSGTVAVPNLYGVWIEITAHPASWGHTQESPNRYIPTFGEIHFSDLNGDSDGYQVHYLSELIFAPNRTNLFLRYSFRPGITATIHPLTLA